MAETAFEKSVENLRPFINNMQWDYCVIWKLGDDPSRFIEWGACCCSGGNKADNLFKIKDENGVIVDCRDKLTKHPVRTNACKLLHNLPTTIPLYSGIHGDVLISNQPRWLSSNTSDNEPNGTRVLIPVGVGLIELFSTKHMLKDQKTIDYISAGFKSYLNHQEPMSEKIFNPYSNDDHHLHLLHSNFLPPISQPNSYSTFDQSCVDDSNLSNEEHQSLEIVGYYDHHNLGTMSPECSGENPASPKPDSRLRKKRNAGLKLEIANGEVSMKNRHGPFKSKNLETERNRRMRIKHGLFALRALVPNITKMDRLATLGDAADYIVELQKTIENYQVELKAMEKEDCKKVDVRSDLPKKNQCGFISENPRIEVQVEVNQIGRKDFLVKLVCEKTRGGFSRLMEAMDALELQVMDANITTCNGSVLSILKVEAKRNIEPVMLKHSLIQLVNLES